MGRGLFKHFPYKIQYYLLFVRRKKRLPRLWTPKDYCDFIFRDNFFGRHNKHAYLADKFQVRKYIEEKGLRNTLTHLYGVWDDASKIDFDKLPNAFVIKTNNASATNILVRDKSKIDEAAVRKQLDEWLKIDYGYRTCQPHYSRIKPLILAEEFLGMGGANC